jgi:methylmalonyl-CoA/ethylmalonyl-CoA epimerase
VFEFHHIGIGTTRFDEAIERYAALGHDLLLRVDDPGINVRIAFVKAARGPLIEIVAPLGDNGPLHSLIARKVVPGPYHTCYAVQAMPEAGAALRRLGFMPVSEPTPAVAFGGKPVAFFFERDVGLVELVEQPPAIQAPVNPAE